MSGSGSLDRWLSGVAHDFNNVLTPILGLTEILLHQPHHLADKRKLIEYLVNIHTAAGDGASIVRRLRELYRPSEKADSTGPVHLNRVVQEAISLTQFAWKDQAQTRGAPIEVQTDFQAVPELAGNPANFRELLTNLILNAVDAMPAGGKITIGTRRRGVTS